MDQINVGQTYLDLRIRQIIVDIIVVRDVAVFWILSDARQNMV